MGSVTSALSRSRNTVVQLSSRQQARETEEEEGASEARRATLGIPEPGGKAGARDRETRAPGASLTPATAWEPTPTSELEPEKTEARSLSPVLNPRTEPEPEPEPGEQSMDQPDVPPSGSAAGSAAEAREEAMEEWSSPGEVLENPDTGELGLGAGAEMPAHYPGGLHGSRKSLCQSSKFQDQEKVIVIGKGLTKKLRPGDAVRRLRE
ncbi:procyclic form-specific polypeptide B-alpha-like [Monodelphis domestica]|uniref:procyclic form-specific polypeptide B-alpha-like n=1 Tax=Monodelphis domestica TaxID=13616 RepID=UPI0024E25A7C|nr:procyclic form-specific polypeptide B-alpha-like [Monodelphis domestica]